MLYYVYKHINPINNLTFYIGKGSHDRAYTSNGRPSSWKVYVKALKEKGLTYSIVIAKVCQTEFEAFDEEKRLILEELNSGRVLFNDNVGKISSDLSDTLTPLFLDEKPNNKEWDKHSCLAAFVKSKRKLAKLNQKEFAQRAGVGLRFIRELEAGKGSVRLELVNQVLSMFGYIMKPALADRE
jgi:y4mF family transcriptional regulator